MGEKLKKTHFFSSPNNNRTRWENLAIAAALTFYLIKMIFIISDFSLCENVGLDYCAYWSAGKLINEKSFSSVYNLNLLEQAQNEIYPQADHPNFQTFAVMYLPIFLLPFKFFSLIDLTTSYLIWTFINFVGLILYLRFFTIKISGTSPSKRLVLISLLSLPVFINFYEGQVNTLLVVCIGEFIRNILEDKDILAGLWLGGWLLKPQLLILIIPFLLLKRLFKSFTGFMLSTILIFGSALIFIKPNGFIDLANTFKEAGEGGVVSNPAAMINWRMLGWHLNSLTNTTIGWIVIIIGSLLTTAIVLYTFTRKINDNSTNQIFAFLGIFAATCAVTWHSHLHMSMILIPPLIYLRMKSEIKESLFIAWIFVPVFVEFLGYLITFLLRANNLSFSNFQALALSRGLTGLILNSLIIVWCIEQFKPLIKQKPEND